MRQHEEKTLGKPAYPESFLMWWHMARAIHEQEAERIVGAVACVFVCVK